MKKPNIPEVLIVFAIICVVAAVCIPIFIKMPPHQITLLNMRETCNYVEKYLKKNKEIPTFIDMLLVHQDFFYDGWEVRLIYKVDNDIITIGSFGKDRKIGGDNYDKDFFKSYRINHNKKTLDEISVTDFFKKVEDLVNDEKK